jgi:hypothetical protein
VWNKLPVVQNYNPSGQRVTDAQTALTKTYAEWSRPTAYKIQFGDATNRCPSLTQGCKGGRRQRYDGFNDVGWARLSGGTLGVTWYSTSIDEADMAINTAYNWNTGCRNVGNSYDLQTVYLHENGHVAGLGHSTNTSAVMYPSYQTARCALAPDDIAGLDSIY